MQWKLFSTMENRPKEKKSTERCSNKMWCKTTMWSNGSLLFYFWGFRWNAERARLHIWSTEYQSMCWSWALVLYSLLLFLTAVCSTVAWDLPSVCSMALSGLTVHLLQGNTSSGMISGNSGVAADYTLTVIEKYLPRNLTLLSVYSWWYNDCQLESWRIDIW